MKPSCTNKVNDKSSQYYHLSIEVFADKQYTSGKYNKMNPKDMRKILN